MRKTGIIVAVVIALVSGACITLYVVTRHFLGRRQSLVNSEKIDEETRRLLDGRTLESLECTYDNFVSGRITHLTLAPGEGAEFIGILRDILRSGDSPRSDVSNISAALYTAKIDFHPTPNQEDNGGIRYVIWIDDFSFGPRSTTSLGMIRLVVSWSRKDFDIVREMQLNADVLKRIQDAVNSGLAARKRKGSRLDKSG
jgi:hypothetical protein